MRRPYFFAALATLVAASLLAFTLRADAGTACNIFNGCTGTSTIPAYGQLLIGGKNGEYEYVASSTFGGSGATGFSTTSAAYWLTQQTTSGLAEGSNLYFTNPRAVTALTGQNVSLFNNDAGYVSSSFSTTSAAYWQTTTNFFSTTSAAYFLSLNQGNAFSTTSANYLLWTKGYITSAASTTLLSDNNTFSGSDIFSNASTTLLTITNGWITGPAASSLLALDANNKIVATTSIGSGLITGILPVFHGGTGASSLTGLITTADLTSANISQFTNDSGYVTSSFSTTSADYWKTQRDLFSTTSASYFLSQNTGNAFSTTSANYWKTQTTFTAASTTLLSDTNWWTGLQKFSNASTSQFTATSSVWLTGLTTQKLLALDQNGMVIASSTIGNSQLANSSVAVNGTTFNLGDSKTITAASSTLLSDNSTFTGNNVFSNYLRVGTSTSILGQLTVGSSTAPQTILCDNSGGNCWALRAMTGQFAIATSTEAGTSTSNAFWIDKNGINYQPNGFISQASSTVSANFTANNINVTSATVPTNGLYLSSASQLGFSAGGSQKMLMKTTDLDSVNTTSWALTTANTTCKVPVFVPNRQDFTTGLGACASGTLSLTTAGIDRVEIVNNGNVGIATTTPWGMLSISALSGNTSPEFTVSSSTASATTTTFIIDSNGNTTIGNNGSVLTVNGATSTHANGINLVGGCLTYNGGACVGGSGGSGTVTSVAANNGITGGTITTTGTLSLDQSFGAVWTAASSTYVNHLSLNTASTTQLTAPLLWTGLTAFNLLSADANGKMVATSSIGNNLLADSGVGAGSCTNCNLTYNSKGILTVAANGAGGANLGYTAWGGSIATFNGTTTIASTTPPHAITGIFASSTSIFDNASTTQLTVFGSEWHLGITASRLLALDNNGLLIASTSIGTNFLSGPLFTVTTAAPLGGAATLSQGGTLALTCTGCLTSLAGAASSTLLSDTNWWTGLQKFSNASTSMLTATSSVWLTGITSSRLLAVDNNGLVIATTTIGNNLLAASGVSGSSCTNCNLTYNAQGIITVASNGSGGSAASSTLLSDNNWWTGLQKFNQASTSQFTATSSVWFTGLAASSLLALDNNNKVIASSTIGWNLLKGPASSIFAFDGSGNPIATSSIGANYITGVLPTANGGTGSSNLGSGAVSAASGVLSAGTLSVANGGTGTTSYTAGQLIFGDGTLALGNTSLLSYATSTGSFLVGTSSPIFGVVTAGSSTAPQISLSDNAAADVDWSLRTIGGNFYLASSTAAATSTNTALSIINNAAPSLAVGTTTGSGILNLGTDPTSGSASTTIYVGKMQISGQNSAGAATCAELVGTAWVVTAGACTP